MQKNKTSKKKKKKLNPSHLLKSQTLPIEGIYYQFLFLRLTKIVDIQLRIFQRICFCVAVISQLNSNSEMASHQCVGSIHPLDIIHGDYLAHLFLTETKWGKSYQPHYRNEQTVSEIFLLTAHYMKTGLGSDNLSL